ncbi:MAG: hypothetical protein IJI38_01430 [Clostridia bacterium]|nr:hypothetical protein [Clostridia bacterium]
MLHRHSDCFAGWLKNCTIAVQNMNIIQSIAERKYLGCCINRHVSFKGKMLTIRIEIQPLVRQNLLVRVCRDREKQEQDE